MPNRPRNRGGKDLPKSLQMFQHFVDVRDLRDGSTRTFKLLKVVSLFLPTKKGVEPRPSEELLRLECDATSLEAKTFDELIIQLRQKYPDEVYERVLRSERDYQSEQAMHDLFRVFAAAALKRLMREKDERNDAVV